MNIYIAHGFARLLNIMHTLGVRRNKIERMADHAVDRQFYRKRIKKALANFSYIFSELPDAPHSLSMLEFGTGAHGIDIMVAYLLGFKKIITVDINNHMQLKWAKSADIFFEFSDNFRSLANIAPEMLRKKIAIIQSSRSVAELLKNMSCAYIDFDKLQPGFSQQEKIDCWYSESNLQRIPLRKIQPLFDIVANEMSHQAIMFHRLDLADIHSQPGYQLYAKKIHRFDFLKYSDNFWRILNCDRYSSQNRLRIPHYRSLFEAMGFSLVKAEYVIHSGDIDVLKKLNLADMFCYLTPKQLAVAHARIVCSNFHPGENKQNIDFKVTFFENKFADPDL